MNDIDFVTANGTDIPHYGQEHLSSCTDSKKPIAVSVQVVEVRPNLASGVRFIEAGSRAAFDADGR